jgi:SAM-dependent methyltransferase
MITAAVGGLQGLVWDRCARDWAEIQEPQMGALYDIALKALMMPPGTRLLDIGCAAGTFCKLAADSGVITTGLDSSGALLDLARQRIGSVSFIKADMETLPFDDESFDVVTGLNTFYYAISPLKALTEARRVLKRRGRLIISNWGDSERCDATIIFRTLNMFRPFAIYGTHNPYAMSTDGALRALTAKAGFTKLLESEAHTSWNYPNENTVLRGLLAHGSAQSAIDHEGELCIREAVLSVIKPFRLAQGGYRIQNFFKYLVAQKY